VLDFPDFVSMLEQRLGSALPDAAPESDLRADLALDSLSMAEILVLFDTHHVIFPDELITELHTLADLHHYFNVLSPRPGSGDEDAEAVGS
jgi:acyl carrier protein